MEYKRIWAGFTVLAGVLIIIWWVQYWAIGLMDCWIGSYCSQIIIPAIFGLILIVVGIIFLFKK